MFCFFYSEGVLRACWNKESGVRPKASELVEFLANNPRLISPSLDVPLASVQMDDTTDMEINLNSKPHSEYAWSPHKNFRFNRSISSTTKTMDDSAICLQMDNSCQREPLLSVKLNNERESQELNSTVPNGHAVSNV